MDIVLAVKSEQQEFSILLLLILIANCTIFGENFVSIWECLLGVFDYYKYLKTNQIKPYIRSELPDPTRVNESPTWKFTHKNIPCTMFFLFDVSVIKCSEFQFTRKTKESIWKKDTYGSVNNIIYYLILKTIMSNLTKITIDGSHP